MSTQEDMSRDLVVVGSGAAGLSAALAYASAAEAGGRSARITILERAPEDGQGGATRWTGSLLRVDTQGQLDPGFGDMMAEVSDGRADMDACRILAQEAPSTIQILRDLGVEFFVPPIEVATVAPAVIIPVGGGAAIVDAYLSRLADFPDVRVEFGARATKLVVDDSGTVCAVLIDEHGSASPRRIDTAAVILACGSFAGNPDMLTEYLGERAAALELLAPGLAYNTGDGIRMATEVGAAVTGDFTGIHSELADPRATKADAWMWGHPLGIVVNEHAQRFIDEGAEPMDTSFEEVAIRVWRDQNQKAFFIFDDAAWRQLEMPVLLFATDQPPVTADSIGGLAADLGLDPAALQHTVETFNAACDTEKPFDLSVLDGKATRHIDPPKSNWANAIATAPFYAYPATTVIAFPYGGLRADTDGRVLTDEGAAIPGLYAAGEIVGLYWGEYPGATSVLRALTWGRRAGLHAHSRAATQASTVGAPVGED